MVSALWARDVKPRIVREGKELQRVDLRDMDGVCSLQRKSQAVS